MVAIKRYHFQKSEHGGEPLLFFILLLLAWQIRKRKQLM
jgi:hypothetical protein